MVTLEEAQNILIRHAKKTEEIEVCSLMESLGRVAGEDLYSRTDNPPFPRSPLDGYAVRAEDTKGAAKDRPAELKVTMELLAGDTAAQTLCSGQAARIMTGACIPPGADAVIRQEETDYGEEKVQIYKSMKAYENYCFQGEDFKSGDRLIQSGETIDAVRAALAAGMGYEKIKVRKQPKIAVLTTGSELQEPGGALVPGNIYDSNRFLTEARLREWNLPPIYSGRIRDDAREAARYIAEISGQTDLIITTGGVSVGKKDIMHEVNDRLAADRLFWKVKLKPGSPAMVSVYRDTMLISLSGNPFGAAAGMELFVRPVLRHMTGDRRLDTVRLPAVMEHDFPKRSCMRRFVRAMLSAGRVHVPAGLHSSGALSSMKDCNCLIDIPAGNEGLRKGDSVWVVQL